MELSNIQTLKANASHALRRGREPKKVVLWYAGITTLLSALIMLANVWLSNSIENYGGLGNLGTRSILSTVKAMLPLVQMLLAFCLQLGYLHAMLRICRGQYADHTDLKVGFDKFLPLLRLMALQGLLYFGVGMFTYQAAFSIFLLTPWSNPLMELALSMTQSTSILDPSVLVTEEFAMQVLPAIAPMMLIWLVLLCLVMIPLSYRIRFASMALLDEPRGSAFAALRTSMKMTRRNCMKLFKLDLSFWWYFGLNLLATVLGSLDMLLAVLGIALPMNATLAYFLFYGLYLVVTFAISYVFLNRVQATYVMAYESLHEKPRDSGVVLGSIFDV